jgi:hypothetical protein
MSKSSKSWIGRELSYIFLAPLLVLLGILTYGILFDRWYKDPMMVLEFSGIAYGAILIIRVFQWIIKGIS